MLRDIDDIFCLDYRYDTLTTDGMVSNFLKLLGSPQQRGERATDARIVLRDKREHGAHTAVALHDFTCSLEDEGMSRVEGRKIRLLGRYLRQRKRIDLYRGIEALARLGEIVGGLRFHRSSPWRRSSLMNPVRSR